MKTFFNNIFKSNLEKAIIRFHEIADSTGILESGITREPNPNERDELWTITRTFLKRIYSLDINEQMSDDDNREYNQLCHWSIVALHWNDLQLSDEAFSPDNGRFRRDTIALAICLYTRLSSRYKYFNKIKSEFIIPHAYGSVLLWTLNNITNCNTDNFFGKYEPGRTKEALKDYHILFNKYGRYHVEDDDCDNKDLKTIWYEIYHRFSSDRKPYQFVLDYIWMGPGLPGGMGLLSEDRDMNKAFLQKMLVHNQFPDDWCSINDLAYVYIYFATTTDNDLAKSEEIQILSVLFSWSSGEKDEDKSARALSCYHKAMELFSIDQSYERFLCVLTNIYSYIDKIQKGDKVKINTMLNFILKDLAQVALADEVINANEFHLIEWIRKSWKIDIKLFNDDIYEIYENDKIDSKENVIEEESAREEETVRKDSSEFLTDYPGDLYCKNQRWDSVLGQENKSSFQPFPNVFEDGEYKYEDLFRRFTHEEVNVIVEKIKCTGTLIYLPFVHRILSKKFDIRGLKIPFWFDPFIISGALNGAGGIFYFEQNGFYSNTYDAPGNWLEPTNISSIMHVDMIVHLDQEAGYNGYWNEYISGDEEIVTTLDIEYENPASGNGGEISLIQTNGTEYASTLPIVEAIWDHSWSSVVEASKETSIFVLPTNCEYFDSWDDLLIWARSKENSQDSKGISEKGIIVKEDNSDSFSSDELQVKSLVHIKSMLPFAELFKAEKNIEALDSIFEKSHNLWVENLNKIKGKVEYIMFCESPPFDANGEVSNYIYDREGEAKGMYLKAPYKALKGEVASYPPKAEMIDYLNSRGFLFIDLLPLSINFSPKRNTKKYEDFVKYFWNGSGTDLEFPEFIVQNRLNELQGKISPNVKVCFALRSVWKIVNSLSDSSLKIGDYKMDVSNETLVGLNTAGQPDVNLIMKAFKNEVIIITENKQPLILSLYEEFKMIFECYMHFSKQSGTMENTHNVFFEEHPEFKQLVKEDRDRLRRESGENFIKLTLKESSALFNKNIKSLKDSIHKQQVMKGFLRLFSTNGYDSTDLLTSLLDCWIFEDKNEVINGVNYNGSNRIMFWNEMLKNGLNPLSDNDYVTFFNIIILNAKPSNVLSSITVNTINCSEKIIQFFGYNLGSPEIIVKRRFKEFFSSKYRWVREAVAACSIFDVDDIKEFVSNAPERYILKGFLANNNISSELKTEILNLLEDEVKFPIEMETYTIANSNNVSPIEISSGICDGVGLLAHFKEGDTIDLIESLRYASYGHSMFGVDEFADTLILESGEMESISLTNTSKDNKILHKVENGKFSFCVYESSKINSPLEDWKKYSICLEDYLDTTKISSDTESVIIDGHSEYDAIIGYTYTTIADEIIHFDEIEDFNSVGIDQYVCLYFGYNDKWIELDFDELCSEIQVRELNISTEEELVKFIKEFLNKQTNIKENIITGELGGIIDNINPEKITDWLVTYAEKLEIEDRHEILVLGINRSDLEKANADNILELGSVDYGDWDALIDYMPGDGVIEEEKESIAFISETKEECEECINFDCDCDYNFHRVVLLCEKSYVWSITLFSRR